MVELVLVFNRRSDGFGLIGDGPWPGTSGKVHSGGELVGRQLGDFLPADADFIFPGCRLVTFKR